MAEKTNANLGFEKQIWDAACVLWGHIPAAEYRKVIVGLIFLRYISSAFERKYQELVEEGDGFENDRDEYMSENIFFVPEEARWNTIASAAHTPEIGTVIDNAMRAIENENKALKNVLPKNYANPDLDKRVLGDVVDLFTNNINMDDTEESKDLLGRTYEYCIAMFAEKEGVGGGEYYTPASLRTETLNRIEFDVPSLGEQDGIISILYPIERKIELNNQINNNLEQQAQALYQKLCVECTSPELISLADLMDYAGGSQPPASEFIFEDKPGYIRFVQIRDYDTDGHITYIPESPRNKLCEEHDIMIARYGASLGRICAGINGAYNVALAKVFPKEPYYREFLRCYLSSHAFYEGINNKGGRSAQAGFNQSDIKSFELIVPTKQQLQRFEEIASILFEQRLVLNRENRKLAVLRDTLLPQLMSGELDVSNIDL